MRDTPVPRHIRRQFVQRKLLLRLWMFALVFCGLLSVVLYQLVHFQTTVLPVLGSFGLGLGWGVLMGRINKIVWHDEAAQAVGKLDRLGGFILGLYVVMSLSRWWVLRRWFAGHELTVVVLGFTGGIMLGRLLFTRRAVVRVLKEQDKY